MADINEVHSKELALFQTIPTDTGTQGTEWITYRPVNQLTEGSALEFNIPSTSTSYMDLKRMRMNVKVKLEQDDGTNTTAELEAGPINAPLHSLFSQVDMNVQQQPVSQVGPNYPYKAYLDLLLDTEDLQLLSRQYFFDDDPQMANTKEWRSRAAYLMEGRIMQLISDLKLDFCQQDRLLLNGVPINLKFWQTSDSFRLLVKEGGTEKYKLKIVDAVLEVAIVKVNPGVLLGHADALKETSALYPYTRSVVKTFAVPSGQFSFTTDDLFQGEVPSRLILGLVPSAAVHGDYTQSPYNFKHFGCNYVGFYVNGQSMPSHPLQPNYEANNYMDAFQTLIDEDKKRAIYIDKHKYKEGYCLYVIDPRGIYEQHGLPQRGHTRLELKFANALTETVTVIAYGKFPALAKIDGNRNVTLE